MAQHVVSLPAKRGSISTLGGDTPALAPSASTTFTHTNTELPQPSSLPARTFPGQLDSSNYGAADWGWQGLVAYGSQCLVVLVDPDSMVVVQTLSFHHHFVTSVKWERRLSYQTLDDPYRLRLASGDSSGRICLFDVVKGKCLKTVNWGRSVCDMEWHPGEGNILLALHHHTTTPTTSLCLWNMETQSLLWRKDFQERATKFAVDPFESSNVTLISQGWIHIINDISESAAPGNVKKYRIVNQPHQQLADPKANKQPAKSKLLGGFLDSPADTQARQRSGSSAGLGGETVLDPQQVVFSSCERDVLLIVFPREILVFDMEVCQAVGTVVLERGGSPFSRVLPTRDNRGILFCLHENGSVSARVPREGPAFGYDVRCQSESVRLGKQTSCYACLLDPRTESRLLVITNTGRLMQWDFMVAYVDACGRKDICRADSTLVLPSDAKEAAYRFVLSGVADRASGGLCCLGAYPSNGSKAPNGSGQPDEPDEQTMERQFSLREDEGVQPSPLAEGEQAPMPLVAVGKENGMLQIINVKQAEVVYEISVHATAISGVEWTHPHLVYTYACEPAPQSKYKNSIKATDLRTGRVHVVRPDKYLESAPILDMRFSPSRRYALIAFKGGNKPVELWDMLRLGSILRDMPQYANICAISWCGRLPDVEETPDSSSAENLNRREQFITALQDGGLHIFVVEGRTVRLAHKLDVTGTGTICSSIAWTENCVLMGDHQGSLHMWRLNAGSQPIKSFQTNHGAVQKILFCPVAGSLKFLVLYVDGLELWDAALGAKLAAAQGRKPGGAPERLLMTEIGWLSNMPLLACSDGSIRLIDPAMRGTSSPLPSYHLPMQFWNPALIDPKTIFHLKTLLQHQSWRGSSGYDLADSVRVSAYGRHLAVQLAIIGDSVQARLLGAPTTPHRCMLVAQLYGDEWECRFWQAACHYLERGPVVAASRDTLLVKESDVKFNEQAQQGPSSSSSERMLHAGEARGLSLSYDLMADGPAVSARLLARTASHARMRASYEQTRTSVDEHILYGQHEAAMLQLMETDSGSPRFVEDTLKACLVAALCSPSTLDATVTLSAVSLMSAGHVDDGVHLLCLVGKRATACNYLQSHGMWTKAARLAKATLPPAECAAVLQRWADHMASPRVRQYNAALLLQLSLGQFQKVLQLLCDQHRYDTAALFLAACQEYDCLNIDWEAVPPWGSTSTPGSETEINTEGPSNPQTTPADREKTALLGLVQEICTEYARFLSAVGLPHGAAWYCLKANAPALARELGVVD